MSNDQLQYDENEEQNIHKIKWGFQGNECLIYLHDQLFQILQVKKLYGKYYVYLIVF